MENINLWIIPLVSAVVSVGGAVTVILRSRHETKKLDADTAAVLTTSAIGLLQPLENKVKAMEGEMSNLKVLNLALQKENEKLMEANSEMNTELRSRIKSLEQQIDKFLERITKLDALELENENLKTRIHELENMVVGLRQKVVDLTKPGKKPVK